MLSKFSKPKVKQTREHLKKNRLHKFDNYVQSGPVNNDAANVEAFATNTELFKRTNLSSIPDKRVDLF